MRYVISTLTCLCCFLPTVLCGRVEKKYLLPLCLLGTAAGGIMLGLGFKAAPVIFAVVFGGCVWTSVAVSVKSGKVVTGSLYYGFGLVILNSRSLFSDELSLLWVASSAIVAALCAAVTRWFSKWEAEDFVPVSAERKASPVALLVFIQIILLDLTVNSMAELPLSPMWSVAAGILLFLAEYLWNDMALAVIHSTENADHRKEKMDAIDQASRDTNSEIYRRLTEYKNRLGQISLAYGKNDTRALNELIVVGDDGNGKTYSSNMLLDAVLRQSAKRIEKAELADDFFLQIGDLEGFSLSDVGVIIDIMLDMLTSSNKGSRDVVRFRAQQWNDMLVLTAGRRESINTLPDIKRDTLNAIAGKYGGWVDISEKGRGVRVSAVLFGKD